MQASTSLSAPALRWGQRTDNNARMRYVFGDTGKEQKVVQTIQDRKSVV